MGKLWKIINQPVIIWFLSTIAVGIITFSYNKNEELRRNRKLNKLKINSIDLEISSRLKFYFLQRSKETLIDDALLILDKPTKYDYSSGVYPEYAERSIRSLIVELSTLVSNNEREELEIPLRATYELAEVYLIYNREYRKKPTIELKYLILDKLNKAVILGFNLERWTRPIGLEFPNYKKLSNSNNWNKALDELNARFGNDWIEEELRNSESQ